MIGLSAEVSFRIQPIGFEMILTRRSLKHGAWTVVLVSSLSLELCRVLTIESVVLGEEDDNEEYDK